MIGQDEIRFKLDESLIPSSERSDGESEVRSVRGKETSRSNIPCTTTHKGKGWSVSVTGGTTGDSSSGNNKTGKMIEEMKHTGKQ